MRIKYKVRQDNIEEIHHMKRFLFHLSIERICLREFYYLAKRNLRYSYFISVMYLRSIVSIREARLFRAAYCLARHIDDVVDRDRLINENAETYVKDLLAQIIKEDFNLKQPMAKLTYFILNSLDARKKNIVKSRFIHLIESLLFDLKRSEKSLILNRKELKSHLCHIFEDVVDISLVISNAEIRAKQIPNLFRAQACLYSIRDIKRDLGKNLCNIPQQVMQKASSKDASKMNIATLLQSKAVRNWQKTEFFQGETFLLQISGQLHSITDRRSKMVLLPISKSLKFFILKKKKYYSLL